jgi:phosphoribosylamine---glycine ligase
MRVLVVGGGGREHALIWKLAQSPLVKAIACAPGNGGISGRANCINVDPNDIENLAQFAYKAEMDLTIVGPEAPLTRGIVDLFRQKGLNIVGPTQSAARIEGSKSFAKDLMKKYDIPTADYQSFTDHTEALSYIKKARVPLVIKADGLAAGKGVFPCRTTEEALDALDRIMVRKVFGDAGNTVVVEEFLTGEEASFLVFTDGHTVLPMPACQDHKAIYDGDQGPNTGGMGAYSPAPVVTPELENRIMEKIMIPTIEGLASEGCPYEGVLYAGLMIKDGDPKVLEYNARFGDPEAQPLLMRMKSDLAAVLNAIVRRELDKITLEWDSRASVCVVMASKGYPGSYEKGKIIRGLEDVVIMDDIMVFHAGTDINMEGHYETTGGRVLGVTSVAPGIASAIDLAYKAVSKIHWDGCYYRRDIGKKALLRP